MKDVVKKQDQTEYVITPPDGLGRLIPVGAYIKIFLGMLENDNFSRVSVLADVLEGCGIDPEDINIYNRNSEKHMQGDWEHDEKYSWQEKKS